MKCPGCGSDDIRHSHRVGFERLMGSIFFYFPYRCRNCSKRFWVFKNPLKSRVTKIIVGMAIFLIALLLFIPLNNEKDPVENTRDTKVPVLKNSAVGTDETLGNKERNSGDSSKLESDSREGTKPELSSSKAIKQIKQPVSPPQMAKPVINQPEESKSREPEDQIDKTISSNLTEGPKQYYYSLHIGSFKNFYNAKAKVDFLTGKGLYAWWEKVDIPDKGEWFRVFIGRQKNKAEAIKLGDRLKTEGIIGDFLVNEMKSKGEIEE